MDDSVKRYRERRDARVRAKKARVDDQWITMRGTHVLIDDGGQVAKGPDNLKNVVKQGGGYKSKAERKYGSSDKFSKFMNNEWNTSNRNVPPSGTKGSEKAGGSSGGETRQNEEYESIPYSVRAGGRKYASPDDVKKARETVSRFIKNAQVGDVYQVGGGFGSAGGQKFKVVTSRGKTALAWQDNDGYYGRPVQMSRANVESFIGNGAKFVKNEK